MALSRPFANAYHGGAQSLSNVRSLSRFTFFRALHTSRVYRTYGVYQDLANIRVRTPWIEALRKQENEDEKNTNHPVSLPSRDLKPKKMSDSFHRVIVPLAQDPWLCDNYLNANGHIRLGTLFMDLDALSGVVAYKHTGDAVTTVTAAVDRINIKHPLRSICDLELSGQVTYATGRSSMEISLQAAKAPESGQQVKDEDILLTCAFTMVSLDPATKKPVAISPLQPETAEEKRLFALGEKNLNEKKAMAKTALRKQTPHDQESDLIHAMWLKQLEYDDPNIATKKPDNLRYMSSTVLHSSQIMQPQFRNRHNFMIFAMSQTRPTFISLDPSTFDNPVPVGSVLYLKATVAYTDPPLIKPSDLANDEAPKSEDENAKTNRYTRVQIRIDSKVRNVEHGETKPTGQFNYTFLVDKNIKVMPQTYSEFMIWVDARRRAERVRASIDENGQDEVWQGNYSVQRANE